MPYQKYWNAVRVLCSLHIQWMKHTHHCIVCYSIDHQIITHFCVELKCPKNDIWFLVKNLKGISKMDTNVPIANRKK